MVRPLSSASAPLSMFFAPVRFQAQSLHMQRVPMPLHLIRAASAQFLSQAVLIGSDLIALRVKWKTSTHMFASSGRSLADSIQHQQNIQSGPAQISNCITKHSQHSCKR